MNQVFGFANLSLSCSRAGDEHPAFHGQGPVRPDRCADVHSSRAVRPQPCVSGYGSQPADGGHERELGDPPLPVVRGSLGNHSVQTSGHRFPCPVRVSDELCHQVKHKLSLDCFFGMPPSPTCPLPSTESCIRRRACTIGEVWSRLTMAHSANGWWTHFAANFTSCVSAWSLQNKNANKFLNIFRQKLDLWNQK